jgi:hypothetical protein
VEPLQGGAPAMIKDFEIPLTQKPRRTILLDLPSDGREIPIVIQKRKTAKAVFYCAKIV